MTEDIKEAHDRSEPSLGDVPITFGNIPRIVVLSLIRLYQLTFSRLLPPSTCRFYPTCSHYGYESIRKHGLLRGGLLAVVRILKCQPFNPGGYDPVP